MRPFPGERVVWQGPAAVGVSWPPVPRLLLIAFVWWIMPVIVFLLAGSVLHLAVPARLGQASPWPELLGQTAAVATGLGVLVALILATVLMSKVAGPSYLRFGLAIILTPAFGGAWFDLVQTHGLEGALERSPPLLALGSVVLGLPLLLIVLDVFERLDTIYVITDRRVAAVLGARKTTIWEYSRSELVLVAGSDGTGHGAHVVVSMRHRSRALYLRHDDPEVVLELVRRPIAASDA